MYFNFHVCGLWMCVYGCGPWDCINSLEHTKKALYFCSLTIMVTVINFYFYAPSQFSLPPLLTFPPQTLLCLPCPSTSSQYLSIRGKASPWTSTKMAHQIAIRLDAAPPIKAEQSNPV